MKVRPTGFILIFFALALLALCVSAHKVKQKSFLRSRSAFLGAEALELTLRPQIRDSPDPLLKLKVSPEELEELGSVEVSWQGIPYPTTRDYVTFSCGPRANLTDFIDKVNVTTPNKGPSPDGSVTIWPIVDMRCKYTFDYIRVTYDPQTHAARHERVATSGEISMRDPYGYPRQGRVSLGNDPYTSLWISFTSAFGPDTHVPVVRYGYSDQALEFESRVSNSSTYTKDDMCQNPATLVAQVWYRDPGYQHHVLLSNLKPMTRVYYSFGLQDRSDPNAPTLWSDVYSTTPIPSADLADSTSFIAYGDMGDDPEPSSYAIMKRAEEEVVRNGYQFVVHFGDISYARGNGFDWDVFGSMLSGVATKVPYLVSIGNHEYDYDRVDTDPSRKYDITGTPVPGFRPSWGNYGRDSGGECVVPMHHRWRAPNHVPGSHHIYWYAFEAGPVYIIQMSSEHDWTRGSLQYNWLEKTLSSIDRNRTPFVVITSHRMMYTTQLCEDNDYRVSLYIRKELEPLLKQYKVSLMLVGHQHSYERTCPVYEGECLDTKSSSISDPTSRQEGVEKLRKLVRENKIDLDFIFRSEDVLSHPNQAAFFDVERLRYSKSASLSEKVNYSATSEELQAQYPSWNPHYAERPENEPLVVTKHELSLLNLMPGPSTSLQMRRKQQLLAKFRKMLTQSKLTSSTRKSLVRETYEIEKVTEASRLGQDSINIWSQFVPALIDRTKGVKRKLSVEDENAKQAMVEALLDPSDVISSGTVHVTAGTAGAGLEKCGFDPKYGPFSRVATNSWGLLKVRATRQQMVVEFVRTVQGDTYDRIVILPWTD